MAELLGKIWKSSVTVMISASKNWCFLLMPAPIGIVHQEIKDKSNH